MIKRIDLGCHGHLIVAQYCRWRRHTQVGRYRVSSVGDYYSQGKRQTLGGSPDSWFETMVFKTTAHAEPESEGCGCMEVADFSEIDGTRYVTAGAAQRGHENYVKKYLELANRKPAGRKDTSP